MKLYPEDVMKSVEETKLKAENSKRQVQPPADNPSKVDPQWESVRATRRK